MRIRNALNSFVGCQVNMLIMHNDGFILDITGTLTKDSAMSEYMLRTPNGNISFNSSKVTNTLVGRTVHYINVKP